MKNLACILIPITALFLSSCAGLSDMFLGKPEISEAAAGLISSLERLNGGLKSFNGVGKIKLWDRNGTRFSRVAWIGAEGNRIRIQDIANPSGMIIASDGKRFYFVSNYEGRYIEKKASDPDMKRIVSIPIRISEIVELMAGRIPLREYRSAKVATDETSGESVLVLLKWREAVEKIYFGGDGHVQKVEAFDAGTALVYRVEFDKAKTVSEKYRIPFRITVSNDAGEGFQLSIHRYQANVPVEPAIFSPAPAFDK